MKVLGRHIICIVILVLVLIGETQIGHAKDNQAENQLLGFTCVNAYWPITRSQAPSADIITSPFGIRYDAELFDGYDFHEGIDIRAQTSLPVHTFTDGTVDDKGFSGESGNWVRLKHNDPCNGVFYTFYAHLTNDVTYQGLKCRSNAVSR